MSPTAAWLAEASKPDAAPVFVYQFPDLEIYFSSDAGHYPVAFGAGASEPHHAGRVDAGGLPRITRRIQNIFSGRSVTTVGAIRLIDDGSWDAYFGGYDSTMRGMRLHGYVTFPGLAASDAVLYLRARVLRVRTAGDGRMELSLTDERTFELGQNKLAAGTYTSQKLGDVVKARLTAAGLTHPDDYDTAAWNAWTAAGEPGDYTVTGSWSEGSVFTILDSILDGALSWHCFRRDGKFYIEKFADLGGSPSVDADLDDAHSVYNDRPKIETFEPVFRQQTVLYNAGGSSVVKTVDLSTSHAWWPTGKEGEPVDCGIDGVTDATALADDRLALLSSEHLVPEIPADIRMLAFDLGATVHLTLGGKKLPAVSTIYHRVHEITEDPNAGETLLGLWTKTGGPPLP